MSRPRTKTAVHFFLEGGFLVRGTLDPHEALALAVEESDEIQLGWNYEMAVRNEDDEPEQEHVQALGDDCHTWLANAKPGLYRIVPAPPGDDEYSWFMRPAQQRGRGAFEGVVFW